MMKKLKAQCYSFDLYLQDEYLCLDEKSNYIVYAGSAAAEEIKRLRLALTHKKYQIVKVKPQ